MEGEAILDARWMAEFPRMPLFLREVPKRTDARKEVSGGVSMELMHWRKKELKKTYLSESMQQTPSVR